MTLKECFHVKGYDASDGYISRCFDPSTYDSYLTQLLRAAGALIIAAIFKSIDHPVNNK